MATWKAEVFVNSSVGRITTEVEAATSHGAKEQIYAKHGNVQQITNLREVSKKSQSSSSSEIDGAGAIGIVGLVVAGWAFITFTPWILMLLGGSIATWIGEKVTGQSVEDYVNQEHSDNGSHTRAAIVLALALFAGGVGFVKGDEIKKGFDAPSDTPTQVQQSK